MVFIRPRVKSEIKRVLDGVLGGFYFFLGEGFSLYPEA